MNFLDAHRIAKSFAGGKPLPFLLAMSGTVDPLRVFLTAAAATTELSAEPRLLAFNTLQQLILSPPQPSEREVFLLFPWDLVPVLDWRTGVAINDAPPEALLAEADKTLERITSRGNARLLFVAADVPPLYPNPQDDSALQVGILQRMRAIGVEILDGGYFSLGSYLASGCPFAGSAMGTVAKSVVAAAKASFDSPRKVLVTDLDNVMWHGLIADGIAEIACSPEGRGYRHFLYQSLLAKLKAEGTVLAAVSRNNPDDAVLPLRAGMDVLSESDFICVIAGYGAKSAQIAEIAERLNLNLNSFVLVDDSPIELAEVSAALPSVECVRFPNEDDALPALFSRLSALFARTSVTEEDRTRTELYRRRLEGISAVEKTGSDLTDFLHGLEMKLIIQDRSRGDRTRAVQLINKTNQFNLNGRRFEDKDVAAMLAEGGKLYGATLTDRTGSHGEILVCLIGPDGTVEALVESCRVFQRRVEHAFFAWLATQPNAPTSLRYEATDRNEPLQRFMIESSLPTDTNGLIPFDAAAFGQAYQKTLDLFKIETQ